MGVIPKSRLNSRLNCEEPPGMIEADSLEILKRRATGHELEVMMKCGNTHSCLSGQILGSERPGVVGVDLFQDPGDPGKVVIPAGQGA